ncbi:hypothetical protein ACFV4X_35005 [Streptomyces ardesiacus]|uniref:hypothetical protein n=1 Tax=Streptomyces ardesiacus TaxID=285564 RepID=UPI00365986FC
MSAELDVMALAAPAASALTAEVVRGGWESLRGVLGRFLRHDGEAAAESQLVRIDEAEETLVGAAGAEHEAARRQMERRLRVQLAAYLDRNLDGHPDLESELAALLPGVEDEGAVRAPVLRADNNEGSQIIQASGNVDGGSGGINFGVPPRNGRA